MLDSLIRAQRDCATYMVLHIISILYYMFNIFSGES